MKKLQRGGIVAGMLVGIVVAVVALGGAYWFFSKQTPKYDNLAKNQEFAQQSSNLDTDKVEALSPKGASDTITEFHPADKIPGRTASAPITDIIAKAPITDSADAVQPPSSDQGSKTPPPTAGTQTPPAKKDGNIKPVAKRSFLQVGAFKEAKQADEQKAQLAMIGVQSEIQQIDLGGTKGVFHRVRIGPFTSETQLQKTQAILNNNKIKANVVTPN